MPNIKLSINCLLLLVLLFFSGLFSVHAQKGFFNQIILKKGHDKISTLEYWAYNDLFYRNSEEKKKLLDEFEILAKQNNDKITVRTIEFYRAYYISVIDFKKNDEGLKKMLQIINETEKNSDPLQAAYFKHVIGYYYFTSNINYILALQNMLQAHYEFKKIDYQNVFDANGMLDRLAYLYYHLNNYNESIKHLKQSLQYSNPNTRKHIGSLNTIGQSYREMYELDSAQVYFKKSRDLAVKIKDTAWIGINSGSLGSLHLKEKKAALSYPYILESYRYAKQTKDKFLIAEALTNLGNIALLKGDINPAIDLLKEAEKHLMTSNDTTILSFENYVRMQNFYSTYSSVFENNGETKLALKYLKASNTIRDSITKRAALSKNISINHLFEAEQNINALNNLAQEKNAAELKKNFFVAIGILFFVIILLLYGRSQNDKKIQLQKEQLLNLEKDKIQLDLDSAKSDLTEYLKNLKQKTELLELVESELNHLKEQNYIDEKEDLFVLDKLNQATILTEDDWNKFKKMFEKVHNAFFTKLKIQFPNLTPAETRLCALLKLNLNSNDMATMMGISIMGVKKSKQRLRKKINLDETEKLENIFVNF